MGIMSASASQDHSTPVRDHSKCHVLVSSHLARWGGQTSETPGSATQRRSSLVMGSGFPF